jgi:membrane protease YdiL (CAAX protease family)
MIFQPVIELHYGQTDLSALQGIKGNFLNYIILILIMWVVAAFGEEILYRGYMTRRLAIIFGNSEKAWFVAIMISSMAFGFAHLYQGISGVITTGFIAVIFASIFYKNQNNLWVGILTHGFYDVFGITMIFLGKERVITNWAQENLFFFI